MPVMIPAAMLRTLLVAVDGSATSDRAVSFAVSLARRHSGSLIFCHAVDHVLAIAEASTADGGGGVDVALLEQTLDEAATSILTAAARRATDAGLVATTTVLDGRAAPALVAFADEHNVDAIVMGTQGKRGLERLFLGSTVDDVLRRTDVPVFVVPPTVSDTGAAVTTILAAIDDSDPSDAAAAFALDVAQADGATLVLCGVAQTIDLFEKAAVYGYDPTPIRTELEAAAAAHLAGHADRARLRGIACERSVVDGDPADEILKTALARHAELIVLGTHGRRGVRRFFVGSVAEDIVRRSPVPVVVIRSPDVRLHNARSAPGGTRPPATRERRA